MWHHRMTWFTLFICSSKVYWCTSSIFDSPREFSKQCHSGGLHLLHSLQRCYYKQPIRAIPFLAKAVAYTINVDMLCTADISYRFRTPSNRLRVSGLKVSGRVIFYIYYIDFDFFKRDFRFFLMYYGDYVVLFNISA